MKYSPKSGTLCSNAITGWRCRRFCTMRKQCVRSVSYTHLYAFRCHLNAFHGTVFVIIQTVDADGTATTTSGCIDASIMINEIPVALELDNSLMKMCIRDSTGDHRNRQKMEERSDFFRSLRYIMTVSYTHLDVYKRQAKYLLACSEYAIFTSEIISTIRRLVSSGRHSSLQRFPASM